MYKSNKRLIILDADGTTVDAYSAVEQAFARHGMTLGDEASFQKRHHLFKYLGGLKEFPSNIKKNIRQKSRKKIVDTLTEVYRTEARLYPGIAELIRSLIGYDSCVGSLIAQRQRRCTGRLDKRHNALSACEWAGERGEGGGGALVCKAASSACEAEP